MVSPKPAETRLAGKSLRAEGLEVVVRHADNPKSFSAALQKKRPDVVLFDQATPGLDALTALRLQRGIHPDVAFILLVTPAEKQKIPRELNRTVSDLVLKEHPADLAMAVRRALREQQEKKLRVRAEATSQRNQQLLQLLIDQVTDCAIYVLDAEGHVATWNSGAERLTGYPPCEALGKPLHHCFTRDEIKDGKPGRELELAMEKGRFQGEGWCRRKDGSAYYAQWTITALRDEHGNSAGFLKVARDMTERQQYAETIARMNGELEQRVRERTAQLEDANQELESFSYSVSHDLRAPLRHIDGFIEILRENITKQLDAENREYLDTIAKSAREMGKLIDALLAFSRVARTPVNKRRMSLDLLMRDVLTQVKNETQGRKIEWVVQKLPEVDADPMLLKQALLNLISNAVKYTRPRARARIEIGADGNDRETIIFVRDNGVGFDMKHGDKLFGAFQRLHRSAEFEGTGVGLANVRRIVHRHGGRTWAEGEVDKGATFYFSLSKDSKEDH